MRLRMHANVNMVIAIHQCSLHITKMCTWFPTLESGWIWAPAHVGTCCPHLCHWNQSWSAAVMNGSPFYCTVKTLNEPSDGRVWVPTPSCIWSKDSVNSCHFITISSQLLYSELASMKYTTLSPWGSLAFITFKEGDCSGPAATNAVVGSDIYILIFIVR